ncbi:hypothetical protein BD324DRAFT_654483 [Kockovaella imperatae]|uniref:Protein phosphatase methylesterase 1 n=1 Tax=Kockovaella imperatae TaxID=4999 RepID=A0A1Y1URS2_9TREE|nr:hypothetical protein BD324DRAFT_654483 [Kockovaella imperatae]ORX40748.1 hypothetical protein BD324DRAFT_654483 [Kockovaella imperatae]
MSDVFRQSVLNRLPQEATKAPWSEDEEQKEELDELGSLPGSSKNRDLSPLSAAGYFDQALEVEPPGSDTTFRVYVSEPTTKDKTYLVCHHGAGSGGLSFAALAKYVREESKRELGLVAFDCRGHGKVPLASIRANDLGKTRGGNDTDWSLSTLVSDFMGIIDHMFKETKPAFVLLGHSMGAAPVISAAPLLLQKGYTVSGVVVLDVVEGTAIESLPLMKSILAKRPTSFRSVEDGIYWHVASATIRDTESARLSVPALLVPAPNVTNPGPQSRQVWRTDLGASAPYWSEWYTGLSSRFLMSKCARLLVLAGQERLDKELMVGQMQGKFQLEVMADVGHYLHEVGAHSQDNPRKLAAIVVAFWRRNTRILVLPPKMGSQGVVVKKVGEM